MERPSILDGPSRLMIAGLLIIVFGLVAAIVWMANATPAEPDIDAAAVRTEAVASFVEDLTASAPAPTPTLRLSPTRTTLAPTAASGTPGCHGLRFVRDVTIPDNTGMDPAEVFTKSWQVENSGTCAWKPGYQVILVGGLAMGGSPFRLTQTVLPGGSIHVSIKMISPTNQTGIVQGTWKMSDEAGLPFGDYLSVVIVVTSRARPTSTIPFTATP